MYPSLRIKNLENLEISVLYHHRKKGAWRHSITRICWCPQDCIVVGDTNIPKTNLLINIIVEAFPMHAMADVAHPTLFSQTNIFVTTYRDHISSCKDPENISRILT